MTITRNDGGYPITAAIPLGDRRAYWKARSRRARRLARLATRGGNYGNAYHYRREADRFAGFARRSA